MQPFQARLFIAIPVPPIYRPILNDWSKLLNGRWNFKRWLHPDDYHITLKFIGECDFHQALAIKEKLKNLVITENPFSLSIEGLGTFDNRTSSKILWAGVQGDLEPLNQLHNRVDKELEKIGFTPEDKMYRPHVTLARNHLNGIIKSDEIVNAPSIKEGVLTWKVNEIVLYQTHLGKSPAYQPLAIYPFEGRSV